MIDHTPHALRVENLTKAFGATRALSDVSFDVHPGEVHALIGENGAGKSTLIKIVAGIHQPDSGRILIDGRPVSMPSPAAALAAGIATIPQELRLAPNLSVAENICLGNWPTKFWGLAVDRAVMKESAHETLGILGLDIPPNMRVDRLDFAERQLIVIARALRLDPGVLILDEPTAALERREVERLIQVLDRLRARNVAIVYVSHKLNEVVEVADRCTVLRDSEVVDVLERGSLDVADMVRKMTGRALEDLDNIASKFGVPLLESELATVRSGEIAGLGGLLGSGARAHVFGLFGAGSPTPAKLGDTGEMSFKSPRDAMRHGLGLVAGERSRGLVPQFTVRQNIVLACLPAGARAALISRRWMDDAVVELIRLLDIRPADPDAPITALSGGNQQKVILAKWLARQTTVLLLDEPTHGIDMAAKAQIHKALRAFVAEGRAALVSSTDSEELLDLSDSITALREGQAVGRMERATGMSEERLRELIGG